MTLRSFLTFAMILSAGVHTLSAADADAPLADAVKQQDWKNARELLDQETNFNSAQADGMTALHWSVFHDNLEMVQRLLDAGAKVSVENRYGVRPLAIACLNGHGQIVELLLKQGADPNHPLRGGETPLMTAARTGKPGPVRALLAHGAEVNARERKGQTALIWAAAEGNVEAVDLLLKAGADFKSPLKSGFTPLFFAVREGKTETVFRLLAAGLDVNGTMQIERRSGNSPPPGTSPLILAVENGHLELAAKLLDAGANPNDKRTGYTPLHAITWVRKPLRGDGDPPPIGSGKVSTLEFVRILLKHGAEINIRHGKHSAGGGRLNKTDATPFLLAAETGDIPLLNLLIELGADPKLTNKDNCTPLLAASGVGVLGNGDESAGTEEEAIASVKLLLELGADINAVDDRGNSAMHGAAFKSWTKLVQFLADHGADVNVWNTKNKFGWTPLLIAQGHRPGNFRPSAETILAVENVMHAAAPAEQTGERR